MRKKLYFDINDIEESHIDPNEIYKYYSYTLTGDELLTNIKNISSILEGKESIDLIALDSVYRYLVKLISSSKSIKVNDIFEKITDDFDIAELDKIMISNTIVVVDGSLKDEYKEVVKKSLEGKKEVIFTKLYKEEENSFGKHK